MKNMGAALEELLTQPKPRSEAWLTSTFPTDSDHPDAPLCSAGYQVCLLLPPMHLLAYSRP